MAHHSNVDRQVQEYFFLGLVEYSDADIIYPIVLVEKKEASIRMWIDYNALTKVTKVPAYPMKDAQKLIFTKGMAKWLALDLLKRYY